MFSRKRIAVTIGFSLFVLLILAASVVLRPMFGYPRPINYARWLLWSRSYKTEVLAQPNSANEELKHIEWDGWGWGGQDFSVYLVFDPADSLSGPAKSRQSGKLNGIPCEVSSVRRIDSHWYIVFFDQYVDQSSWDSCK